MKVHYCTRLPAAVVIEPTVPPDPACIEDGTSSGRPECAERAQGGGQRRRIFRATSRASPAGLQGGAVQGFGASAEPPHQSCTQEVNRLYTIGVCSLLVRPALNFAPRSYTARNPQCPMIRQPRLTTFSLCAIRARSRRQREGEDRKRSSRVVLEISGSGAFRAPHHGVLAADVAHPLHPPGSRTYRARIRALP